VAITDEQRAMLQLLLEGGQGYDDIGSLLGIAPDEVRRRARSALQEMGGSDPDAQVGLSDFLLGQADPIGRADAIRHLQSDPEANALAGRLSQQLRVLAPKGQLPEIPAPRGGRRAAPPPPAAPPVAAPGAPPPPGAAPGAPPPPAAPRPPQGPGFFSRLSARLNAFIRGGNRRTQLAVALAAGLLIVVGAVLLGGSGGGSSDDCKPVDISKAQQAGIPTIQLQAVGAAADASCAPSGQVTLVPIPQQQGQSKNQLSGFALQTNAAHLEPNENGDVYVLWLYQSDTQARPIGRETVDQSGNLNGAAPLPANEILLLQSLQKIRLSRVTQAESQQLQQSLQGQGKKAPTTVAFVGTPVLEGNGTALIQQLQQIIQQAQAQAQAQGQAGAGAGSTGGTGTPGGTGKSPGTGTQ